MPMVTAALKHATTQKFQVERTHVARHWKKRLQCWTANAACRRWRGGWRSEIKEEPKGRGTFAEPPAAPPTAYTRPEQNGVAHFATLNNLKPQKLRFLASGGFLEK